MLTCVSGFRVVTNVSGFKFQGYHNQTFLPAWKAERSDGSLGRSLRTAAMVARDNDSGWYCMVSLFMIHDS